MYYNDPYTELYHYGVPGMKWGIRKKVLNSISGLRSTPLGPRYGAAKDWETSVRNNAREMYRQGRMVVRNVYDKARSAAGNAYEKSSSAVNAGFKAAGLKHYQSAILIGGGIALAGAATAGGIALYKHHKKKQAEKNNNKN